jgi:hypothetical protein
MVTSEREWDRKTLGMIAGFWGGGKTKRGKVSERTGKVKRKGERCQKGKGEGKGVRYLFSSGMMGAKKGT